MDAAALARYSSLDGMMKSGPSRLIVLSADDDALDFRDALDVFAGQDSTTIIIYPNGGHTLNLRKHPARASIVDFVSNH